MLRGQRERAAGSDVLERERAIAMDFASVELLVAALAAGRPIILHDGEARKNRGDLVLPAQCATPKAINFMAIEARGLICLALTDERASELQLALQCHDGRRNPRRGAFTVSIEARDQVDTGISAFDRARTIAVAADCASGPDQLVSPGHVFPIVACGGGVLDRAGHTEAAVDLVRLAGFPPLAVTAAILNDEGDVSSLAELKAFGRRHGIIMGRVVDLISFRQAGRGKPAD
jgi:3,4-dihydroxy 2-butanone 4-phosphate synthase/GTP cyclohydrolase II